MLPPVRPELVAQLFTAAVDLLRELRSLLTTVVGLRRPRPPVAYETVSLALQLELQDARGERAVLRRRQRVRFLGDGGAVVRELLWGEGDQLVRYQARGARRIGVRSEGSKRAVLLDPDARPSPGDRLTIESRRTIRSGFRARQEYCEAFLERPTGSLELTVVFPPKRPPTTAQLVQAPSERVLRRLPVRFRADGRAVLRCRLRRPEPGTTYSLRWAW